MNSIGDGTDEIVSHIGLLASSLDSRENIYSVASWSSTRWSENALLINRQYRPSLLKKEINMSDGDLASTARVQIYEDMKLMCTAQTHEHEYVIETINKEVDISLVLFLQSIHFERQSRKNYRLSHR